MGLMPFLLSFSSETDILTFPFRRDWYNEEFIGSDAAKEAEVITTTACTRLLFDWVFFVYFKLLLMSLI